MRVVGDKRTTYARNVTTNKVNVFILSTRVIWYACNVVVIGTKVLQRIFVDRCKIHKMIKFVKLLASKKWHIVHGQHHLMGLNPVQLALGMFFRSSGIAG